MANLKIGLLFRLLICIRKMDFHLFIFVKYIEISESSRPLLRKVRGLMNYTYN